MKPYYDADGVTIYHGDCRDVLPGLTERGDLLLADPPYGVNYASGKSGKGGVVNDSARLSVRLCRQTLALANVDHVLWFTRWDVWPDLWEAMAPAFPLRGLLVWDKGHPGMGDLTHWGNSYELIASAGIGRIIGGRDSSILRFPWHSQAAKHHVNEKPVALLRYLIEKLSARRVVDPFCGSGSSLLAARLADACAVGVELDEAHCEVAANRLREMQPELGEVA